MASHREIQQTHRRAILAAARRHIELGTGQTQRVDIFRIVESDGIWLAFKRLEKLYGVYLRNSDASGIFINTQHPLSLQRYTAAHEYGHHVLGHSSSVDDENRIIYRRANGWGQLDLREIEAQTFAAYFLMPPELVNFTLREMGLRDRHDLSAVEAYKLSLEFGTSYSATVVHLSSLGVISRQSANILLKERPINIKAEISRGVELAEAWADVWLLEESDNGKRLLPRVNDEIIIELSEIPTSGYMWVPVDSNLASEEGSTPFLLTHTSFVSSTSAEKLGGSGKRQFVFRVVKPGSYHLQLAKQRPWAPNSIQKRFDIDVDIQSPLTGDSEQGFSISQRFEILAGAA